MERRGILRLPFFRQKTEYTCGPATLEMVFKFFGLKLKEKSIARIAKTNEKDGTNHSGLINTARKEGFYCFVHEYAHLSDIQRFLEEGLPVIVHYTEPESEIGHYAVVVGLSKWEVILNDPWDGRGFRIGKKEFVERWTKVSTDYHAHGWLMVLSRRNFSIGREYAPKK